MARTHEQGLLPSASSRGPLWPWQVQLGQWKRVLKQVAQGISEDRLSLVAAALAFYAMLALFPGLLALVSLFGLVADPDLVELGLAKLTDILPPGGRELLQEQLGALVATPATSLSVGLAISVLAALWSASAGVDALIDAMNVAYDKTEQRNWLKRRLMSVLLTFGLVVFTALTIALVAVLPSFSGWLGDQLGVLDVVRIVGIARWPALAAVVAVGLYCLYRYAPCRARPSRSDSSGALLATGAFLLVSSLFSLYVSEFASYNKTYGAVGGVVALLFWFYYSSFIILIGAELSAVLEGEKLASEAATKPA